MPYSQVMESERERLKPFRRALSKEDQQAFDRLFDRAKMHTSAGVYIANPWPMETTPVHLPGARKAHRGDPSRAKEQETVRIALSPCTVQQYLFLPTISVRDFPLIWNLSPIKCHFWINSWNLDHWA